MPHFFLALFRRYLTNRILNRVMREAAEDHYRREGVDPYDLAHPIANAFDQQVADHLERYRRLDGDTSAPKRSAYVEGL